MNNPALAPLSIGPRTLIWSFVGLGFIFANSKAIGKMDPDRLIGILIGAVAIAGLGLALGYAFV